jgi:flagellar assembly protein FliH
MSDVSTSGSRAAQEARAITSTEPNEIDTNPGKLTAWQRWELPAFKAGRELARNAGLPTAGEIEQIHQQSRDEGYQLGFNEGKQKGYAQGLAQASQQNQRFLALTTQLEQQVDELVASELMGLSLDIARQMIQQSLKVRPELLLGMVREAIGSLPVFNQSAHVILNPTDAALVRERMGEQLSHSGWKILEDARMERGGARLETANSQIDASLEARWKRVTAAMGQENSWLIQE